MKVLEMEEAESLVGSKRSSGIKTTSTSTSTSSSSSSPSSSSMISKMVGWVQIMFQQRSFMMNIVIVAALVLLFLLFLSGTDSSSGQALAGNSQLKDPTGTTATTTSTSASTSTTSTMSVDMEMETDTSIMAPIDDAPPTTTTTTTTTTKPPPPPPPPPATEQPLEPNPINVYSKFATVEPLKHFPFPNEETKQKLSNKWGKWHFWDDEEDERPKHDFLSKYKNRDIPNDDFPDTAWQVDAVFVNHYLNDANQLVTRAMEAIYAEYGYSSDGMTPEELVERSKSIFHWTFTDDMNPESVPPDFKSRRSGSTEGGWMTKRSFNGLVRRLLHAMMTSDTFTVVLGGHSVAAGSGNKFQQNYAMQFHKIMAPIFARLGVKLITRNMAQGGLGTLQSSFGMSSIFGDNIDVLLWDSRMTEDVGPAEFFLRQGILGSQRVPLLLGMLLDYDLMTLFHNQLDADIGLYGTGLAGIPITTSPEQAMTLPYATRYISCSTDAKDFCSQQPRFCTHCWIDPIGDGSIIPPTKQKEHFSDNGNWHPGWRELQLRGRVLSMMMLRALQTAIEVWTDNIGGGPPLDESYWHVTEYYDNIRNKLLNTSTEFGQCHTMLENWNIPSRICNTPMKGVTEYTPRQNQNMTGISSIAKPAPDGTKPMNTIQPVWEGPEPPAPCLEIPEGEIDVYAIVTGRRRRTTTTTSEGQRQRRLDKPSTNNNNNQDVTTSSLQSQSLLTNTTTTTTTGKKVMAQEDQSLNQSTLTNTTSRRFLDTGIIPGKGWEITDAPIGRCDGTFESNCNMGDKSDCLFSNYNSARGAVTGNEFSGWLVLNIDEIKEGLILIKIDPFYPSNANTITGNWTTVNNEQRRLRHHQHYHHEYEHYHDYDYELEYGHDNEQRKLKKYDLTDQPDTMVFEYAINGQITTIPRDEFIEKLNKAHVSRVVWILTLLDDPNFTGKNVELAIRMRGCERACTYGITHVYWA